MADRLNDTDPQSPVALQSRTDPGLGVLLPAVASAQADAKSQGARVQEELADSPLPPMPAPGSASIEELLDGITRPRPPPSRRDGAEAGRLYAAARPAPPKHPTPPIEAAVFSPDPSSISEREATTVPRASVEPRSLRPVIRRAEERTVYTGRRALVRNAVAVILSAAAVTAMMMGIMRWKEGRSPRAAMAPIVLAPLPPSAEVVPTGPAPTLVIVSPPPVSPPPVSPPPVSPPPVSPPPVSPSTPIVTASGAPSASAASMTPKHGSPRRTRVPPPTGSLDDLNREISH